MVEVLERIAEKNGFASVSKRKEYMSGRDYSSEGVPKDKGYSTFAEMYLEKPVDMGITASVSTWRGIPTIDDW